jgi:integrase
MINVEQEQQQEQWQNQHQHHQPRIYEVTAGLSSKHTREVYQRYFNRFLDHIQIHDLQVLLDFSPKVIKQMISDYVHYLQEKRNVKRDSIKVQLAAILRFFKNNNDEFHLTIRHFQRDLPPDESMSDDRPYTTEEITQTLQVCDLRTRVAIHLLFSSGMRIGALHSLQIGDLAEVHFNNTTLYRIEVYARTRDKYYTFCTPESYNVIKDYYLKDRERCGEVLKDKSPLIREQFNADNPFTINSPRFVSNRDIEYMVERALKRAGVRKPREVHMSHGYRKYFVSQCESSQMKSVHVSILSGHDIGVKKRYYKDKDSVLLEDFVTNAVDALTIDPTQRLQSKVKELETVQAQEIARLRKQLQEQGEKHSDEYEDIRRMYREIAEEKIELRKFINARIKLVADARRGEPKAVAEWERLVQEDKRKLQALNSQSG